MYPGMISLAVHSVAGNFNFTCNGSGQFYQSLSIYLVSQALKYSGAKEFALEGSYSALVSPCYSSSTMASCRVKPHHKRQKVSMHGTGICRLIYDIVILAY